MILTPCDLFVGCPSVLSACFIHYVFLKIDDERLETSSFNASLVDDGYLFDMTPGSPARNAETLSAKRSKTTETTTLPSELEIESAKSSQLRAWCKELAVQGCRKKTSAAALKVLLKHFIREADMQNQANSCEDNNEKGDPAELSQRKEAYSPASKLSRQAVT